MKLNLSLHLPALLALLLAACTTPANDAAIAPYHPPTGTLSYRYEGALNQYQRDHLAKSIFPRLTSSEWELLNRINRRVNGDFTYLSDEENYGILELPVTEPPIHRPVAIGLPPSRYADCEDYALSKKQRLVRSGFSASRLFVASVEVTEAGTHFHHAVLVVPEGREWWILDNKENQISRASHMEKWWGWDFARPPFDQYQVAKASQRAAPLAGGSTTYASGSGRTQPRR